MSPVLATLTVPGTSFQLPWNVIILGAMTGMAYSLFGMGLTLTYQSSRVINFAQGAMGGLSGLLVASLVVDHGWNYWIALVLALVVSTVIGALIDFGVVRQLRHAPRLVVLVATIAVAQLLQIPNPFVVSLNHTKLGETPYPVPFRSGLSLGALHLGAGQILILIVSPLVALGLTAFLRGTNIGMASRGAAENEEAAQLSGIPVKRVSLTVWSVAGLLAGISAVLLGPTSPVLGVLFGAGSSGFASNTNLLLEGLGAAMIGGLSNLPQVFLAGMGIGVVETLVSWNYPAGGANQLVLVAIILGSLLLRRDLRQLARGGEESSWSLAGAVRALPERLANHPRVRQVQVGMLAGLLVIALIAASVSGPSQLVLFSAILVYVLVSLSLVMLTGWAGQVSLGHFGFVALGAFMGGRMHQLGYPLFGALAFAAAFGGLIAAVVGLPAVRMRGLFLAVSTLAFAVLVDGWLLHQSWLVHTSGGIQSSRIGRPHLWGIDFANEHSFFLLMLAITVAAMAMIRRMQHTGVYRRFVAVRDNEPAAAALSVAPASTKLVAFVLSGILASVAGYFYGSLLVDFGMTNISDPVLSLSLVTMVIVGGPTSITGAVLGAVYIRGIPYFVHSAWAQALTAGGGLLLVILLLPGGLATAAFRLRDLVVERLVSAGRPSVDATEEEEEGEPAPSSISLLADPPVRSAAREAARASGRASDGDRAGAGVTPALAAREVSVRFGGVQALDRVSMEARRGEIVGLIGPNGAGKTTLFDVLNGLTRPTAGRVLLHGEDVSELRPEQRALLGLGRSFQQARLFDDLTVLEAFQVALEREEPTELVPSLLGLAPSRRAERHKLRRAWDVLELVGLADLAERKVAELSTGTRRVAELGCVVALGADVVLLDEPTGGIAQREAEAMVPVLRAIREHLDATFIVVAHDIPLIVDLVDRVYVLSAGRVLATGGPQVLHEDPAVAAAYLGTELEPAPEAKAARRTTRSTSRSGTRPAGRSNGTGRTKGTGTGKATGASKGTSNGSGTGKAAGRRRSTEEVKR